MGVQFAVKEACPGMANPDEKDWDRLKRLAKYLEGRPRAVQMFPKEGPIDEVTVYTDTD